MRISVCLLLVAVWIASTPRSDAAPYGRAGVFVVEKGDGGEKSVATYSRTITPAPGKTITVKADSNVPATFLAAAFTPKGDAFLLDLDPLLFDRTKGFSEITFPDPGSGNGRALEYERADAPGEVFVLVFAPGDQRLPELRKLLASTAASTDAKLRALLAKRLRSSIARWAGEQSKTEITQPYRPTTVAATLRGDDRFPWQAEHSYRRPFPEDGPAIFHFTIGPE